MPSKHNLKPLNLDAYNENLHRLKLRYQTKYLEIVDLYRDDPMVLNHTDINSDNILVDDNGTIQIIDFEWCGLASDYWDYANFIREEGLRYSHLD
ncbi:MAG: phosphotransferase [Mycoplasmoidaceae bacterium]|nr:phosphotransferase [Mycoplasmoidaceae bacterium]